MAAREIVSLTEAASPPPLPNLGPVACVRARPGNGSVSSNEHLWA